VITWTPQYHHPELSGRLNTIFRSYGAGGLNPEEIKAKKISSRLNRRRISLTAHLTGQVGQADSHGLKKILFLAKQKASIYLCHLCSPARHASKASKARRAGPCPNIFPAKRLTSIRLCVSVWVCG
jgi:hypothetical protein